MIALASALLAPTVIDVPLNRFEANDSYACGANPTVGVSFKLVSTPTEHTIRATYSDGSARGLPWVTAGVITKVTLVRSNGEAHWSFAFVDKIDARKVGRLAIVAEDGKAIRASLRFDGKSYDNMLCLERLDRVKPL